MKCIARCKSNQFKQCSLNAICNNKFCNKHNNKQNIKTINVCLFTQNEINDFIINYIIAFNTKIKKSELLIKKNILLVKYILQYYNYNFNIDLKAPDITKYFKGFISNNSTYLLNLKHIIKIQSICRMKNIQYINKLKGPGLFNRKICTNEEDFYTFEHKTTIPFQFFFSYKENNSIYCFDIRSFKLLIEKFKCTNPYNRNKIIDNIKNNALKLIEYLQKNKLFNKYKEETLTSEQKFNQYIIETFQKIDSFGYNTNINWFKTLSIFLLKKLWYNLEDIWNYRSNLSIEYKHNIITPTHKQPFRDFNKIHLFLNTPKDKESLQNIILKDINIFISSGVDNSYCNIGCLYVLTALSVVSNECLSSMPWLQQL